MVKVIKEIIIEITDHLKSYWDIWKVKLFGEK